jgi:phenol hydroxylase P0 protein
MTRQASAKSADLAPGIADQCYVRVTGMLEGGFVEFEFSVGDPDLAVELVMQFSQFQEFSKRHQAVQLTPEQGALLDDTRMKWRFGAPGIDH